MLYYNYKIVTHYTIIKLYTVLYINNTVIYSNVYCNKSCYSILFWQDSAWQCHLLKKEAPDMTFIWVQ